MLIECLKYLKEKSFHRYKKTKEKRFRTRNVKQIR